MHSLQEELAKHQHEKEVHDLEAAALALREQAASSKEAGHSKTPSKSVDIDRFHPIPELPFKLEGTGRVKVRVGAGFVGLHTDSTTSSN